MKKIKLGHRLEQLKLMIIKSCFDYEHIWDCCCDHGLLGMALLQETKRSHVHFVDVVQSLVDQVEANLLQYYFDDTSNNNIERRWHVECQDVANINLAQGKSNLVIVAGVGGEKTIELLSGILNDNVDNNIELLLCPVHQNYRLREFLIEQGFGLIKEKIVKENNRFYELLHVSQTSENKLSLTGREQWDYSREDDRDYLTKMIQHFERMANDPKKKVKHILKAYQELLQELISG